MGTKDVWKEFSENEITHSGGHHLLAILELTDTRGYARVTDVARFLQITTGSASTNLKSLKNKGLVQEDENRFVSLSERGEQLAKAILERRSILKNFLVDVLEVDSVQAEIDACKAEHLLSIQTTEKMDKFLDKQGRKRPALT